MRSRGVALLASERAAKQIKSSITNGGQRTSAGSRSERFPSSKDACANIPTSVERITRAVLTERKGTRMENPACRPGGGEVSSRTGTSLPQSSHASNRSRTPLWRKLACSHNRESMPGGHQHRSSHDDHSHVQNGRSIRRARKRRRRTLEKRHEKAIAASPARNHSLRSESQVSA